MKTKLFSTLFLSVIAISAFSATIRGSRPAANEKSSGFFVEAFSAKGRVLFKSIKFDEKGRFVLDFPTNEALVYWIDNFPVYVLPNQEINLVLPERQSGAFVIGGAPDQNPAKPGMLAEDKIRINGKSEIDNLLINEIHVQWADLIKAKKGSASISDIDFQYAKVLKLISSSRDQHLLNLARFYNEMRYLELKLQYLRTNTKAITDKRYFKILSKISLNNPALNSLKSIGLRSFVSNYYAFLRLSQGADVKDEDLTDNGSVGKMKLLLAHTTNERLINEQLSQVIIYRLSISGWDSAIDEIMLAAIEKTTDPELKKNLGDLREKYSKVSKNAPAPDFAIPDATGKMVNLSDFKGKVVAIDVWATWCVPCMHSLPYFLKLREKYQANPNVVFLSISTDNAKSKDKWLSFLKSKNMNGVELHAGDEKASAFEKAYNITGIPRYILIDQAGKIIEDHAPQASEPEFEKLIQAALSLPVFLPGQQNTGFSDAKKKDLFTHHPQNWHMMSFAKDSVFGIEAYKAYDEILKGKTAKKVIVAVIDAGVAIDHEDLKSVIWTNEKEIPDNGIDDDGNGYIDDVHGWNFLGSADGKTNIEFASTENDREFLRLSRKYEHTDTARLSAADKRYFNLVKRKSSLAQSIRSLENAKSLAAKVDSIDRYFKKAFPNTAVTIQTLYDTKPEFEKDKDLILMYELLKMRAHASKYSPELPINILYKISPFMVSSAENNLQSQYVSSAKDGRGVVMAGLKPGENWGNNQLSFKNSDHGTHVAGAIAAVRGNHIGMDGIADNVEIMPIRVVVPQGDEYDEDVAKAIRYAVDNGATVINMSFGKRISPKKELVDEALKYAEKKDVLIVRGAGNFTEDTDQYVFYPSQFYNNGKKAAHVITVGATSPFGEIMGFSNYGKKSVDLFAPGFDVYSTGTDNSYSGMHGTSMASPVVCGVAALLRSYYPGLSAAAVKHILLQTVTIVPEAWQGKQKLQNISVSGGIVNAYQALKLADQQLQATK